MGGMHEVFSSGCCCLVPFDSAEISADEEEEEDKDEDDEEEDGDVFGAAPVLLAPSRDAPAFILCVTFASPPLPLTPFPLLPLLPELPPAATVYICLMLHQLMFFGAGGIAKSCV